VLDFSLVKELLAFAVAHHFDVAATVGTDKNAGAVGAVSVARGVTDKFEGLVAAGRASVSGKRASSCIASGLLISRVRVSQLQCTAHILHRVFVPVNILRNTSIGR